MFHMLRRNRQEFLLVNEDSVTPTSNADDDILSPSSPTQSSPCPQPQQPVVLGAGYKTQVG